MSWPRPLAVAVDAALEATIVGSFSCVGYGVRRAVWGWSDVPGESLTGRVAVVTGATSGLGRALAHQLAAAGASVVLVGRDPERTRAATDEVRERTASPFVSAARCDLARLDDVRALADELRATLDGIDLLVHNAGALSRRFERTPDGLERTVQTHVVAPFLLTHLLLGHLRDAPRACVLTVSSGGMYGQRLEDLDLGPVGYDGVRAYALAKRAQVVLNEQWARRHGTRARFEAMHPGWVDTPGLASALPQFHHRVGRLLRSPEQGIDTLLWLAAPSRADRPGGRRGRGDGPGGQFWFDRRARWTSKVPWTRTSPEAADRLWRWVADRAGVGRLEAAGKGV